MKDTKKSAKPKNVLTPLRVKTVVHAVKPNDIPVVFIEDDYTTRYNEASAIQKDAEQLMKDLKPVMLPDALNEIFRHNCANPFTTIASVKLQDPANEVTRVSFTSKYNTIEAKSVQALFAELKTKQGATPDINEYFQKTLVGSFDSKIFMDAEGRFSLERFQKVHDALEAVSIELGAANPLAVTELVVPVEGFHNRRWVDFDRAANDRITKVVPNTISFTPCPKAVEEGAK